MHWFLVCIHMFNSIALVYNTSYLASLAYRTVVSKNQYFDTAKTLSFVVSRSAIL